MLKLKADVYSSQIMWLSYYCGRLSTLHATLDVDEATYVRRALEALAAALEKDAPVSANRARFTASKMLKGDITHIGVKVDLDGFRTALEAELSQRSMRILRPGETESPPPAPSQLEPPQPCPMEPQKPSGGRPPKAWWEDLHIEMARQLWNGDLKPERQSDIERAMHDWIIGNGHSAGETQVRERARKLFNALNR